jgi:hypothetical protein
VTQSAEEIAYQESVRALEMQSRTLDELRSRTGLLLAAASVVTSFLGAEVLRRDGVTTVAVLAILVFIGVVVLALLIVLPWRDWHFAQGAKTLLEDWTGDQSHGDIKAMQRFLAENIEEDWDHNKQKLDSMFALFTIAAGLLGVEVVLWTVGLA